MFVPLHDNTPLQIIRFQYVTLAIIVGNIVIYLFTGAFQSGQLAANVAASFGVVPDDFSSHSQNMPYNVIPAPLTFISYMFVHASWMHLLTNMLFLWVFGDNVEDAFGHLAFIMLYLLCGVAAAGVHVLMTPGSQAPLIGASGAVSGVLGSYILLYPRSRILMLMFIPIPIRISAIWVLGIWFLLQVFNMVMASSKGMLEVAWWAHIGGFLAGLLMTYVLRSRLLVSS